MTEMKFGFALLFLIFGLTFNVSAKNREQKVADAIAKSLFVKSEEVVVHLGKKEEASFQVALETGFLNVSLFPYNSRLSDKAYELYKKQVDNLVGKDLTWKKLFFPSVGDRAITIFHIGSNSAGASVLYRSANGLNDVLVESNCSSYDLILKVSKSVEQSIK